MIRPVPFAVALTLVSLLPGAGPASAAGGATGFVARLDSAQEAVSPPPSSQATATATLQLDSTGTKLRFAIAGDTSKCSNPCLEKIFNVGLYVGARGVTAGETDAAYYLSPWPAAHVPSANGENWEVDGTLTADLLRGPFLGATTLGPLLSAMRAGNTYVNVNTDDWFEQIRGQVTPLPAGTVPPPVAPVTGGTFAVGATFHAVATAGQVVQSPPSTTKAQVPVTFQVNTAGTKIRYHAAADLTRCASPACLGQVYWVTIALAPAGTNGSDVVYVFPRARGPYDNVLPPDGEGWAVSGTLTADQLFGPLGGQPGTTSLAPLIRAMRTGGAYVSVTANDFTQNLRGQIS